MKDMQIANLTTITIQTSLLILLVLGIRKFGGNQLHPWVLKCLWGVIALRILIPIQFPADSKWLHYIFGWLLNTEVPFGLLFKSVAIGIWLSGAALLILVFVIRNFQFGKKLKKNRQIYGKKDGVPVYFIDGKIGSCLEGLFVPRIYISRLAEKSFDWCKWIVCHEICHYHAGDNWYGFLRNLCLIVQWFNPLVWYAAKCSVEDCELVCDYKVLSGKDVEEQIVYGKCLVEMAAKKPEGFLQNLVTGNSLSNGSLKKRIGQIGKQTFCSPIIEGILVTVIIGMTLGCFVGNYNKEYTVMNLAKRIPFLEDKIICYQLENPTEENMNEILKNAKRRKNADYMDGLYIVQADRECVAVFFPFSDNYWSSYCKEKADEIVMNTVVILDIDDQQYEFEIAENMLKEEQEKDGYSLWYRLSDIGIEEDHIENYKVYYLGRQQYVGSTEDISNGYIRLDQTHSYDDMWEKKELLLLKNPCGLIKK